MNKEQKVKRAKAQCPVQREPKQVLAELLEKLSGKLEVKATSASPAEAGPRAELGPNLDRLTVGVDLGDQWSHYCILGLQGRRSAKGSCRRGKQKWQSSSRPYRRRGWRWKWGRTRPGCRKSSRVRDTKWWWPTRG